VSSAGHEQARVRGAASGAPAASAGAARSGRGLAVGFLALVPLLVLYELALAAGHEPGRSAAELVLFRAAQVFGSGADAARRALCAAATAWALVAAFRGRVALGPGLVRQVLEGALAALVLGPVLIGLMRAAEAVLGPAASPEALAVLPPLAAPGLGSAARLLGGAAYEELVFRFGLYSLLVLVVRAPAGFLFGRSAERGAAPLAEAVALVGSSLAFAAFHLASVTRRLGPGGEPWSAAVFTWRVLAGMLLAVLFRWRGLGTAAWAHGLFNLALDLGAGPDVFL
jgi:Type II CAAX prenyl endopeptidase Rce1-like